MKFYVAEGVEIELAPEIAKNVLVIDKTEFYHDRIHYTVQPLEFIIDDVYFFFSELVRNNPNKKIFIHHFEPLAHGHYAVYLAIEKT